MTQLVFHKIKIKLFAMQAEVHQSDSHFVLFKITLQNGVLCGGSHGAAEGAGLSRQLREAGMEGRETARHTEPLAPRVSASQCFVFNLDVTYECAQRTKIFICIIMHISWHVHCTSIKCLKIK